MIDPVLQSYIDTQRLTGVADDVIKNSLLANKWNPQIVEEAMSGVPSSTTVPKPPVRFLSIGELFTNSYALFRERYLSLLLIFAVPGFVAAVISLLFGVGYAVYMAFVTRALLSGGNVVTSIILLAVVLLLIFIPIVIIQMWGIAALTVAVSSPKKLSFGEAYKKSWKYVRSLWWIMILSGLLIVGGSIFIIPGIIYSVWYSFDQFVLVDENERGMRALIKSREYVRGHWWAVFFRIFLLAIIVYIPSLVVSLVSKAAGVEKDAVIVICTILIDIFVAGFAPCYIFSMYKNLREVRGHLDHKITWKTKFAYSIVSLLGLLIFLALPLFTLLAINPTAQMKKASDARILSDSKHIEFAAQMYFAEHGRYPTTLDQLIPVELKTVPATPDNRYCYQLEISQAGEPVVNYIKFVNQTQCNLVVNKQL